MGFIRYAFSAASIAALLAGCLVGDPGTDDPPLEDDASDDDPGPDDINAGHPVPRFGYGRVRFFLVADAAAGRTGQWWCDQEFTQTRAGTYKCRSVSGGTDCDSTVPDGELVGCSVYEREDTVNVGTSSAAGRTGQWWCDMHFGNNLGGDWDCLDVDQGDCAVTVPNGRDVSCGRFSAVDESAFAETSCSAASVSATERPFCVNTDYMTTRTDETVYMYNEFVRAGLNRSYGGALFELYGADKRNLISEHGGAAAQLSLWGYDASSPATAFFAERTCDTREFASAAACETATAKSCRRYPTGAHVADCTAETTCGKWGAGAPWNPIQAQAVNCGWNGSSNDVLVTEAVRNGIKMTQVAPVNFTKSSTVDGMTWSTQLKIPHDVPYAKVTYSLTYNGPAMSAHPQEIPAIFVDEELLGGHYIYYDGQQPYLNDRLTRIDTPSAPPVLLPGRSTWDLPKYLDNKGLVELGEHWITVCSADNSDCLTIATFTDDALTFDRAGHYMTVKGHFALTPGMHKSWEIFLFPYHPDAIVAGKPVRSWIRDLAGTNGL